MGATCGAEHCTKHLLGQKVIFVESVAEQHGSVCVLATESGGVYVGQWTNFTMEVANRLPSKDEKFAPFVVVDVYKDRYGLCDLFAARCWVLVAADGRRYELHVRSLDLFADLQFEDV